MTEASTTVADGALARYASVAVVMPLLSEAATVVLVMGDRADAAGGRTSLFGASRAGQEPE